MTDLTRADIELVLGRILFNASNYPVLIAGHDVSGLREKCVDAVWELVRPDPVDVLAAQFETAARDAMRTTVDSLTSVLGVAVLDVDELLADVDWHQIVRNYLAPSD